ncbi:4Fe-4S binding protein [Dysgonomonas sp. Marseille-P4361]|uniref:4Fe-4S binding protein n=1 Tax=Dysgonomonas sp. Marseille-P4361 TaxID=2161820 RepID=UPI000D55C086|nr:4Fe-4S binding protein [Dysgonomonas sp. Marseille-P4361]
MLRKTRIIVASIIFVLITLLFLDFTGILHQWFGWLAKIQLIPAILALNFGIISFLLILTFAFGRLYCSVICPLGVFQDIISRIGKRSKKLPYSYSIAITWLRYLTLILFIVAIILGINTIYSVLDPYSAYGRIASGFFAPLYQLGNNLIADFSERINSYAFYTTEIWTKNFFVLGTAIATFITVFILAWRNGRTYCNTICPVGTILGLISKYSLFKPIINTANCNSCGVCARNCKASCIDSKNHKIDYSRCVTCMNCINKCSHNAIEYTFAYKKNEIPSLESVEANSTQVTTKDKSSRRNFFTIGAGLAATSILKAQEMKVDGGFVDLEDKISPDKETIIAPPGARSIRNLTKNCTACQLCVSVCPNHVLQPSSKLDRFMQPQMSFERGYCRPECTKCSEVCPTGAINLITTADKSAIQIGHAVWVKERCIVLRDEVSCNTCERKCPVNAIHMVLSDPNNPESLKTPIVNDERCIGCGACENLCPSRPLSAIYVEGHVMHRIV